MERHKKVEVFVMVISVRLALALTLLSLLNVANAADWNSCADDLDRLRRSSRDAADIAQRVKLKASDFENCRNFPGTFDLMRDRCRSLSSDYESEVSSLQRELDTTDRLVRNVSSSCSADLGNARSASSTRKSTGNRQCDVYRSYKGRLPDEALMQACSKTMPEVDCKKCLAAE